MLIEYFLCSKNSVARNAELHPDSFQKKPDFPYKIGENSDISIWYRKKYNKNPLIFVHF